MNTTGKIASVAAAALGVYGVTQLIPKQTMLVSNMPPGTVCLFGSGFDDSSTDCRAIPPPGRTMFSSISYGIYPANRPWMDLTKYENIWGAGSVDAPILPWPGPTNASPVFWQYNNGYTAACFTVPLNAKNKMFGQYAHGLNPPGPNIDANFSVYPGDFSGTLGPGCEMKNWPDDLSPGLYWQVNSTNPSYCNMKPGAYYCLNTRVTNGSGGQQTQTYLQSGHN
jgi:hypothetical protein